ncbi:Sodium/hydrogen exchanger 3 [Zea mays]|uniref:Sodium/hydrogen exchanger 3 n=1 Tax=Zea mays TaxID=4577 RepID=A0A3L6ECM3_MAIZE|nr:Sodium/hydrogen exchanger 3 [Zea mays]
MMGLRAAMALALGDPPADYASIAAVGLFVALMGSEMKRSSFSRRAGSIRACWCSVRTSSLFTCCRRSYSMQGSVPNFTFNMIICLLELGDYLALGAIFSATDLVCTLQVLSQDETPFLYSLVFGEGVVNDTTSVVLFNAIQNFDPGNISGAKLLNFTDSFLYLFGSSTVLGASGLLSAYTIKKLYFGRHAFATLSFISETFMFLYVAGKVYRFEQHHFSLGAGFKSCFCFPTILSIKFDQKTPNGKIYFRQQVIVWWAGLMRGDVSIALAYNKDIFCCRKSKFSNFDKVYRKTYQHQQPSFLNLI